ncbi:uncharacterized protein LOC142231495 [Haematobia irritans]|uniref:uncharacterized protein LOC142231495 n=1 Tax=Haematobia irritans TaxID=7368 RepID=UPI003F5027FA
MQDLIFSHQLTHQRTVIGSIGHGRRKWKHLYHWFPAEQNRVYSEMDRIYKEVRKKYGDEIFKEYALEKRLNKRIFSDENIDEKLEKFDTSKFNSLILCPLNEKFLNVPFKDLRERCIDPRLYQIQKRA